MVKNRRNLPLLLRRCLGRHDPAFSSARENDGAAARRREKERLRRPPVFMIIFDELSYDLIAKDSRIDAASFPNMAGLAADGLWFTNATSNHWMTEWASLPC